MTTPKSHTCTRCGIAVANASKCCVDCWATDPTLVRAWRTPRRSTVSRPRLTLTPTQQASRDRKNAARKIARATQKEMAA
ncbi:MAG: hypothetical protein ACOH10_12625 [Rhodoglobus sp.]